MCAVTHEDDPRHNHTNRRAPPFNQQVPSCSPLISGLFHDLSLKDLTMVQRVRQVCGSLCRSVCLWHTRAVLTVSMVFGTVVLSWAETRIKNVLGWSAARMQSGAGKCVSLPRTTQRARYAQSRIRVKLGTCVNLWCATCERSVTWIWQPRCVQSWWRL